MLHLLNQINSEVHQHLRASGLSLQYIATETQSLPQMEFLKPDHTTLAAEIPTHQINLNEDFNAEAFVSNCVRRVTEVIDAAAAQFKKPQIYTSPVYLKYDPNKYYSDVVPMAFDLAVWEYDGNAVRWATLRYGDQHRLGVEAGAYDCDFNVHVEEHKLLKTVPLEINVWEQNINRDVKVETRAGRSAADYISSLSENMAETVFKLVMQFNEWRQLAAVHDAVHSHLRAERYDDAKVRMSQALGRKVGITKIGNSLYFLIDDDLYQVESAFALLMNSQQDSLPTSEVVEVVEDTDRPMSDDDLVSPPFDIFAKASVGNAAEVEVRRADSGPDVADENPRDLRQEATAEQVARRLAACAGAGQWNVPQGHVADVAVSKLTPDLIIATLKLLPVGDLTDCYIAVGTQAFHSIVGDKEFQHVLDPVHRHEYLLFGMVGTLFGLQVISDAYRAPDQKVLDPDRLYVMAHDGSSGYSCVVS